MVAARAKDLYAKQAKERQRQSQGRGKKGSENSTDLKGKATDKAGEAVGVSGYSVNAASKVVERGSEPVNTVNQVGDYWPQNLVPMEPKLGAHANQFSMRPKLDGMSSDWTVRQVSELCKCETDTDAKRVAKKAISLAKKDEGGTFDNIQGSSAPTGTSRDAALRRLRKNNRTDSTLPRLDDLSRHPSHESGKVR
ncbi:hypothetical protein [Crateriforma spongiae]|uniref:hypothetical protein n=1 Tax=Crateriforma spongiae TaxID=2724528 RepID=UPI0039B07D90